ncbi:unnamed protein product [Linum tenue]|uniref:KIB1-4 beta-propeller domain-containing protein n=1 Tax=Linum tenue TaxID=586396 RepID=A0AAV0P0V6_9ROSI|nr:unnamed protein product [Linum tenue]
MPNTKQQQLQLHIDKDSKYPFLLRFCRRQDQTSSIYKLYSSTSNEWYFVDAPPELDQTLIHSSNYGWLLLSRGDKLFFFHPSTGNIIYLPDLRPFSDHNRISFSAPPTSPDCVVFGLADASWSESYVPIAVLRRGESFWTYKGFPNKTRLNHFNRKRNKASNKRRGLRIRKTLCNLRPIPCNADFKWSNSASAPVFHNGAFYCLDQCGRLGVFRPGDKNNKKKKEEKTWRLLDTRHSAFTSHVRNEGYLLRSRKGELMSIVVGPWGSSIKVLKFNEPRKLWQRATSLGDDVIFLSSTSCIAMSCQELGVKAGLENTIHFVRFHGRHNVFYSALNEQVPLVRAAAYIRKPARY